MTHCSQGTLESKEEEKRELEELEEAPQVKHQGALEIQEEESEELEEAPFPCLLSPAGGAEGEPTQSPM